QAYGLTETGPASHHSPLEPERGKHDSVGVVMADTEHRVVDLETGGTVLAPGETGEIIIRGPQLMQGYWNAPEETARALRNGWLYTGDIGSIDAEGYTYVVDCGVVGVPDADAGEVPNAFVVARKGCTLGEAALSDYFSTRLAGYKM